MQYSLTALALMMVTGAFGALVSLEKAVLRSEWKQSERAGAEEIHDVLFVIKQNNLDVIEKTLLEVSNPRSATYGDYLTFEQVGELTRNDAGTKAVLDVLKQHGAFITKQTPYGQYIKARSTVGVWEELLGTTFHRFHNSMTNQTVNRALDVSIPEELAAHVTAVFGTVQFPLALAPRRAVHKLEIGPSDEITPDVLNSYYNIPTNTGASSVSQALFESLGQYFSPSDLSQFQTTYDLPQQPIAEVIGGHESDSQCTDNPNNCAEANLDVQYMMAVSQVTPTTYWYDDSQLAPFTDWIMQVASDATPPLINSISYGSVEDALPTSVPQVFNTEAMKLGTMGVSIFVSSGDDGVANFQARNNPKECGYHPSFPASSPYVTAVGATQGPESDLEEIACQSNEGGVITTGGGFSTIFDAPSYQTSAISNYFDSLSRSQTPVSGYATSGRGYPDISAAGYNYVVVIGGEEYGVSGTSASSPVVAGMASLVNAIRSTPVGFLNPVLYASDADFFNDVTSGVNDCTAGLVCCDEGFSATSGWDPLTGHGSLNVQKFIDYMMALERRN